jgi:hypothetical protein
MCGVGAMTVLDLSVVNVALPSIQAHLHVKSADLQWVVVTYGVVVAGFLFAGRRLVRLAWRPSCRPRRGFGAALAAPDAMAILPGRSAKVRSGTGRWASSARPVVSRPSWGRSVVASWSRGRAGSGCSSSTFCWARFSPVSSWHAWRWTRRIGKVPGPTSAVLPPSPPVSSPQPSACTRASARAGYGPPNPLPRAAASNGQRGKDGGGPKSVQASGVTGIAHAIASLRQSSRT